MADLLRIEDLAIEFRLREGSFNAVNGISMRIPPTAITFQMGRWLVSGLALSRSSPLRRSTSRASLLRPNASICWAS